MNKFKITDIEKYVSEYMDAVQIKLIDITDNLNNAVPTIKGLYEHLPDKYRVINGDMLDKLIEIYQAKEKDMILKVNQQYQEKIRAIDGSIDERVIH